MAMCAISLFTGWHNMWVMRKRITAVVLNYYTPEQHTVNSRIETFPNLNVKAEMSQSFRKFRNFNNLVNVLFLEVSDNVTVCLNLD